jgi:hypothetical protein
VSKVLDAIIPACTGAVRAAKAAAMKIRVEAARAAHLLALIDVVNVILLVLSKRTLRPDGRGRGVICCRSSENVVSEFWPA